MTREFQRRGEMTVPQKGLPWPRLAPGDAADLPAYVLTERRRTYETKN